MNSIFFEKDIYINGENFLVCIDIDGFVLIDSFWLSVNVKHIQNTSVNVKKHKTYIDLIKDELAYNNEIFKVMSGLLQKAFDDMELSKDLFDYFQYHKEKEMMWCSYKDGGIKDEVFLTKISENLKRKKYHFISPV